MGVADALSYFDRIFVLNLPSRVDRRREMSEELERYGLSIKNNPIEVFPAVRPEDRGGFRSVGARGCFMSHLAVLRNSEKAKYERIAIFEDDLSFTEDFGERAEIIIQSLSRSPWDIFYGGYRDNQYTATDRGITVIDSEVQVGCTHFVAFQTKAIGMAVAHLDALLSREPGDPKGGPMDVDGAYCWLRRLHPDLVTQVAVPPLGYQRSSRTDVNHSLWFDRLPVAREIVALARRVKNMRRSRHFGESSDTRSK